MSRQTATIVLVTLFIAGAAVHAQEGGEPIEVEARQEGSGGGAFEYLRAAGTTFVARDIGTDYFYATGGCIQRNTDDGGPYFVYDVQVPHGAEIDYLRVYFYDDSATENVDAALWAFDGAGNATLIANAWSSGTPGFNSDLSSQVSHIVDNVNESLVVIAGVHGGVASDLRLCAIRIRYLPSGLFEDGFETGDTSAWDATVE